ncbi:MAG TPA: hypothetical protein VFQ00_08645 [Terriglobales bacterium]|nr:hypothetical protein [Terriglobales bacterium]
MLARVRFSRIGIAEVLILLCCLGPAMLGQESAPKDASAGDLASRVAELDQNLRATQAELEQSRQEMHQLRILLERMEQSLPQMQAANPQPNASVANPPDVAQRVANLEEQQAVIQSQVTQQAQEKVESASKYSVKLTGLLLFNAGYTRGNVDMIDVPELAFGRSPAASAGSIGATMRQTILGLQAQGPDMFGAKSSANVYGDFFGGFANQDFGVNAGVFRLRTAGIRLDWPSTSLVFAQDAPFFSPLAPTSLATLGLPALAWSGNLWTWTPQIRVEHSFQFSDASRLTLQAGVLDPIQADQPTAEASRPPSPGEQSRQPGYAGRVAWKFGGIEGHQSQFGIGGYFSPQRYPLDRRINAWAQTGDFQVPIGQKLELRGEIYRGIGVGGLGGGQFASIISNGDPALASTSIVGLNSIGAWGQLKYRPIQRIEFNAAIGHDNPFAGDLEKFPGSQFGSIFARNQTSLFNVVVNPESSLLLSLEYRHIQSYTISGRGNTADHINLAAGYKF